MKSWILGGWAALAILGCGGDGGRDGDGGSGAPTGRTVLALLSPNTIGTFNTQAPGTLDDVKTVTGVRAGENLVAIDRRPSTGGVYAVSNAGAFYVLDPGTGAATLVGTGNLGATVSGSVTDIDFDPVKDQIRVATSEGGNFRVDPATGSVVATDADFRYDNGAAAHVYGIAYTNSAPGATTTTLYGTSEYLQTVRFAAPNDGTVGFYTNGQTFSDDASDFRAFDISPDNRVALVAIYEDSLPDIVQIDLATGKATKLGRVGAPQLGSLTFLD